MLAATALSATFIACQKDEAPALADTPSTEVDLTPRIKSFIAQAANRTAAKDASYLSLDSAEWYVEAGLNFDLGEPWKDCTDRALDSLEVSIPMGASGILENNAYGAYNALYAGVASKLVAGENHLLMADVHLVYTGGTEALAKVLVVIGSGYSKAGSVLSTTYGPTEFIYYDNGGFVNNSCGCGSNTAATTCASQRIAQRMNATMDGLSFGCYYTNVESRGVDWFGNPTNMTLNTSVTSYPTGIPATPYKMYRKQGSPNGCLSPSEMSFYTQGTYDVMTHLKPAGKAPVSCSMNGFNSLAGPDNSIYQHTALFTYARVNCGGTRG